MPNIVIFGAPGSGKGTQSQRIAERYGLHHISTGEVLRKHISEGTPLGVVANEYIKDGHLIPDELMLQVLEHELDSNPATAAGVIFDGFPRTLVQAQAFEQMLEKRGSKLDMVLGLEVDEDDLVQRMINRGRQTGRADDNIDTIRERLNVYHAQTSPLRDFYIDNGKYVAIDGNPAPDTIFSNISSVIDAC